MIRKKKKNLLISILLLYGVTLSACCDCAIVSSSMESLVANTNTTIQLVDKELGLYFNQQVVAENKRYLQALKGTKKVIKNSTKLNKGMFLEYDKINFDIKKNTLINSAK